MDVNEELKFRSLPFAFFHNNANLQSRNLLISRAISGLVHYNERVKIT